MLLPSLVQVWSQFLGLLCLWQCFYFAFRVILSLSALINYNTITLSFRDENCPKFQFQFLSLSSVFNMTLPMHDNCCLPSRKTWTYSCGLCPSVHNLHQFVPCTMCHKTLRRRDQLVEHLRIEHNQTDLTLVKHHALKCKTYNLPAIPKPAVFTNPIRQARPTLSTFRR